ncbi:putative ribonuclease H-like domain-containing protein [Tanacetum coccineum]
MLVCLFPISRGTQEVSQSLSGMKWVEAMQEELLQFKLQDVWVLCDLPEGKRVIGTKWVFRNKRDERGTIIKNKARLVAQGYRQEEGVDYDEVFAPVARIEAIRLFLAFALHGPFTVYQNGCQKTIKPASTPIEAHKSLGKDEEGEDVDVHTYRSLQRFLTCMPSKGSLGTSNINLTLGSMVSLMILPFHLEAFSDSDYAGDNHDRRSTSGGCQYLGRRLVSWQCKKQTIVAISSTEAEYVAAASCCAQVLWMQNQLLDYGFNFMNTEIHIDNESTICIVRNPVFHSKTKHIQIRHHFIRDCYEQRLINVVKDYTLDSVLCLESGNSIGNGRKNIVLVLINTQIQAASSARECSQVLTLISTAAVPKSPNDYTPTDASQTSGGDEGLLDIYALNREVVKHHAFWVESQNLKKQKRRRKKHKKKLSSVKLGRNKDEETLSEEHNAQEEDTAQSLS